MKVFIGTVNIASQINDWVRGFKANGIETFTASRGNHSIMVEGEVEYNLSKGWLPKYLPHRVKKIGNPLVNKFFGSYPNYILKKAIKECDIFFFLWSSILPNFSDFELIKEKGKKIVVQFVGDDIRWEPSMKQEYSKMGFIPIGYDNYDYSYKAIESRLSRLRMAEKYADIIYAEPNYAQLSLRPYNTNFQNIILEDFKIGQQQRQNRPKVLHLPSNASGKGTKYVKTVFERLINEGVDFEPIMPNMLPYQEAKKLYGEVDILVGQLLTPGGGKQERELLASNKVVLSILEKNYNKHIPFDCPIVDVNPHTLYATLKEIIHDYHKRVELASYGREYITKYHDPKKITESILNDLFNNDENLKYDYYPTFFRDEFIPESEGLLPYYNKWTKVVKGENWYKDMIPSGERAGLTF